MQQRTSAVSVKVKAVDAGAIRKYLSGVEALAREARNSQDPRVLISALAIMERQPETVRSLIGSNA
jgi:hypothetical protein